MRVKPGLWIAVVLSVILWGLIYFGFRKYTSAHANSNRRISQAIQ
jgi:hypothetical protein